MLMPLISPRYFSGSSFATPGTAADLNLLQQLVPPDVDDADPVRAVVADVRLRPVRQERHVERLDEAGDRLDLAQRLHVDHRDRVAVRVALVVPPAVGRERQVLGRDVGRNRLDQLQRPRVDDVRLVRARAAGDDVAPVRRHHHHVRVDVVAEEHVRPIILWLLMSMNPMSFESRLTIMTTDVGSVILTPCACRPTASAASAAPRARRR